MVVKNTLVLIISLQYYYLINNNIIKLWFNITNLPKTNLGKFEHQLGPLRDIGLLLE